DIGLREAEHVTDLPVAQIVEVTHDECAIDGAELTDDPIEHLRTCVAERGCRRRLDGDRGLERKVRRLPCPTPQTGNRRIESDSVDPRESGRLMPAQRNALPRI